MSFSLSLFRKELFNKAKHSLLLSSSIRIPKTPHNILFSTAAQETNTNNNSQVPEKIEKTEKTEKPEKPEGTNDSTTEVASKDKQIAELKDSYLRCLADMENLRERTRKEVEHTAQFAIQKFAKDLLNTVDVLNLALSSVPAEVRNDTQNNPHLVNLYTGVSLTETELLNILKKHGVEKINPLGEKFDPNIHEAVYQANVPDKEPGMVFDVQKVGYTLFGRIIRPPQVGVSS
ncbi:GrpE-domain-containing protein [Glomus cerebriforme]|uniref:GrpE protein homolog, mitochondrial n=1 Tax=Glomus cerebriforme TaxID=658196 RepID=A0A397S763_9GLOM|nr:GrpE-domain-containing protein [Glomus cerebriforme]